MAMAVVHGDEVMGKNDSFLRAVFQGHTDIVIVLQTCKGFLGFGVVKDYCGHGVGLEVHEEPSIVNYINPLYNPHIKEGMVLAIEPMITLGTWRVHTLSNNWTVVTDDNSIAAHWEHTIAITPNGAEILT